MFIQADALVLPLASNSVHCCVGSPPYKGLRNYGVAGQLGQEALHDCGGWVTGHFCGECYICRLIMAYDEVYRVLHPTGTLFVNIGDSYNGSGGSGGDYSATGRRAGQPKVGRQDIPGLKLKDMCGVPWRFAMALQARGWYLRSEIIWYKNNALPEGGAIDRVTRANESIYVFSKSKRYYWDKYSVREKTKDGKFDGYTFDGDGRDLRSVWFINTSRYRGAHYATFPVQLPEIAIRVGSSPGVCPKCGNPWIRRLDRQKRASWHDHTNDAVTGQNKTKGIPKDYVPPKTIGWQATCKCMADPIPSLVLDNFSGAGSTAVAARNAGRRFVGTELSAESIKLSVARIQNAEMEFISHARQPARIAAH